MSEARPRRFTYMIVCTNKFMRANSEPLGSTLKGDEFRGDCSRKKKERHVPDPSDPAVHKRNGMVVPMKENYRFLLRCIRKGVWVLK